MAAPGSKPALRDCFQPDKWMSRQCLPATIMTSSLALNCRRFVDSAYGFLVCNAIRYRYNFNLESWFALKVLDDSPSASQSSGAASDVPFQKFFYEDQLIDSADSSEEEVEVELDRSLQLKLLSGSCYLPHPEKVETGGEDAHFICTEESAIGVADGVGGWAYIGIDAGLYARELMSNAAAAIEEEPMGGIDPARVLEKAHSITKSEGSSTACIIALTHQGLQAINLGDSGFLIRRDGDIVFQSPAQQHDFNSPYQLMYGDEADIPSSGQVFTVLVASGDVVVTGTDGLFDNLYNSEVTDMVVHALKAGYGPQVTAQKIANLAQQWAEDEHRQTPFSTAVQEAGMEYAGGKPDDITVVVSYITTSEKNSSQDFMSG